MRFAMKWYSYSITRVEMLVTIYAVDCLLGGLLCERFMDGGLWVYIVETFTRFVCMLLENRLQSFRYTRPSKCSPTLGAKLCRESVSRQLIDGISINKKILPSKFK